LKALELVVGLVVWVVGLFNFLLWLWFVTIALLFPFITLYGIWEFARSQYGMVVVLILALCGWPICMAFWWPGIKASFKKSRSSGGVDSNELMTLGRE
jgi:hypothetical protein